MGREEKEVGMFWERKRGKKRRGRGMWRMIG